jgi:hypothetical protein
MQLLQQAVWASDSITFRVAPLDPECPKLLFTISDLHAADVGLVRNMILGVWRSDETRKFFNSTGPGPNVAKMMLEDFINSLDVQLLEFRQKKSVLVPKFNIYAESSNCPNHNIWGLARNFLANRSYDTISVLGPGRAEIAALDCRLCHGVDHPRGMCPFPKVKGWNGPTWRPENQHPQSESSNGNSTKRASKRWKQGE